MLLSTSLLLLSTSLVLAQNNQCSNPRVRKSWHTLSDDEKTEYIRAVKCMGEQPGQGQSYFPAIQNRHDDFASLHINSTGKPDKNGNNKGVVGPGIHFNGVFLPWHRYLVWTYESSLIKECGYKGAQPYWDWSIDTPENGKLFNESVIWDPVVGFGGNGRDGSTVTPNTTISGLSGSCVEHGPFSNLTYNLGPGFNLDTPNPHCLIRNFNTSLADDSLQWNRDVVPLLALNNYTDFFLGMSFAPVTAQTIFGRGIHGGGHSGTGGEMQNVWSSINDPMFMMHHSMIDYVWWEWQKLSPDNFNAMGGPVFPNGTGLTTLDYPIYMAPYVAPDVIIKDVMDTTNGNGDGVLCYTYEDAGHALPVVANATAERKNTVRGRFLH